MGILYLLLSILGESGGYIIDKLNFRRNHISFRQLMILTFLAMSLSVLAFIVIAKLPFPRFSLASIGLLALIALISFGGNVFDYLSLKVDDLSLREPLYDSQPILAGLVGYIIFPAERKTVFLIAFVLGALIVNWGMHRRRLGRVQKKGVLYLLISVALYAPLPSLYRFALTYTPAAYITLFRVVAILFLLGIFFPVRNMKGLTSNKVRYGIASGIICAVGAVANVYAIQVYGVVLTALVFMLGPAMRYLAGYFVLKERVRKGEVVSSVLLVMVVLLAALA